MDCGKLPVFVSQSGKVGSDPDPNKGKAVGNTLKRLLRLLRDFVRSVLETVSLFLHGDENLYAARLFLRGMPSTGKFALMMRCRHES